MNGSAAAAEFPRTERSTGKGRRRRAAAHERRIEQQRLGQYLNNDGDESDIFVAPAAPRRRSRRRNSARQQLELLYEDDFYFAGGTDLEMALALSLSLAENPSSAIADEAAPSIDEDMSYESLVRLENVRCVASKALVASLTRTVFLDPEDGCSSDSCVICQNEYAGGDKLANLPCKHNVHEDCGSEWLLNYSKLCPVCKVDVTESH